MLSSASFVFTEEFQGTEVNASPLYFDTSLAGAHVVCTFAVFLKQLDVSKTRKCHINNTVQRQTTAAAVLRHHINSLHSS